MRAISMPSILRRRLLLDAGYLSRIVRRFTDAGWITRTPSPTDARQHALSLTPEGRAAFEPLQQRSRDEAARLLARGAPDDASARREAARRLGLHRRTLARKLEKRRVK